MATIKSYKSKGKTKYMFKVYLGTDPLTGKRIDTTRRGFSSAREEKQALTQLKAEFNAGKFKTKAQDMTLGELYKMWWSVYEPPVKVTTASYRYQTYTNYFKKYDDLKLSKLNTLIYIPLKLNRTLPNVLPNGKKIGQFTFLLS